MRVPGRTSHKPLSLKPSSLVQNKESVHYLLLPNFMWKKKSRGSEDQVMLYKYLVPFSFGSFTFLLYIYKSINANLENYNLIWVSNMVFHSKERTQIKALGEWRDKMTLQLEEEEEVTILMRLKICFLPLTLCRLLNQVWQNNKLAQDRLKWWTVNTVTNIQVTSNEWINQMGGYQPLKEYKTSQNRSYCLEPSLRVQKYA